MLDELDVDDAVDLFHTWTEPAIDSYTPKVTLRAKFPPWFDGDVRRSLREKDCAFRRKKRSPTLENVTDFSQCRARFNPNPV